MKQDLESTKLAILVHLQVLLVLRLGLGQVEVEGGAWQSWVQGQGPEGVWLILHEQAVSIQYH